MTSTHGNYICDCDVLCESIYVDAASREEAERRAEEEARRLSVSECHVVSCKCISEDDYMEEARSFADELYGEGG